MIKTDAIKAILKIAEFGRKLNTDEEFKKDFGEIIEEAEAELKTIETVVEVEKLKDLYWCHVCETLVGKDHRDEQWCDVHRIPAEAVKQIIDMYR